MHSPEMTPNNPVSGIKRLWTSIKGPKTEGDMVPEPTPLYVEAPLSTLAGIPIRVEWLLISLRRLICYSVGFNLVSSELKFG